MQVRYQHLPTPVWPHDVSISKNQSSKWPWRPLDKLNVRRVDWFLTLTLVVSGCRSPKKSFSCSERQNDCECPSDVFQPDSRWLLCHNVGFRCLDRAGTFLLPHPTRDTPMRSFVVIELWKLIIIYALVRVICHMKKLSTSSLKDLWKHCKNLKLSRQVSFDLVEMKFLI